MAAASTAPAPGYTVWIPGAEWPRLRAGFESMNTEDPDGPGLRLPADPWPAAVDVAENGDVSYSGGGTVDADVVVGESTGYDVFGEAGWTVQKFVLFVLSRDHLHCEIAGRKSPTLAVLAGYWRTPMLVENRCSDIQLVSFITLDGNVTIAECTGGAEPLATVRKTFFTQGLDAALELPGVVLRKAGEPALPTVEGVAASRQTLLRDWVTAHDLGRLALPKGAELSPRDLQFPYREDIDPDRPVVAYARSSTHRYELLHPVTEELGPLELLCARDGVLQHYADPDTGAERGPGALGPDWAEWIMADSVPEGLRTARQPWEGNSTEARLYRLEHNIVDFAEHETSTAQFSTALELETWLKHALGNHAAPLAVHVLDDVALMLKAEMTPLYQEHTYERSAGKVLKIRTSEKFFYPWAGAADWTSPDRSGHPYQPSLDTVMDGGELESFLAVNCLDLNKLDPYLLPAGTRVHLNSWFLLSVGESRTCILFPAAGTMLNVSTDHDGASARIVAREYFSRRRELELERDFAAQWADWLDEEHQLTREEVRLGLQTLDRMIKENSK